MFSEQRSVEVDSVLISHGPWQVSALQLTPDKVQWLWNHVKNYRTLFSDVIQDKAQAFSNMLESLDTYWLEVHEDDKLVGLIYLSEISQVVDANIHILFFDHKMHDKGLLMKEIFEHLFKEFPALNRISAAIPDIYFATKRLALNSGMRKEGVKRSSLLIGGRWQDEVLFGILASESLNGTN